MRASQSLAVSDVQDQAPTDNEHLALSCFVDDPFIALQGTEEERRIALAVLLLFWLVLGFRMAWQKGHKVPRCHGLGHISW
jgi:hypothetical protein